MSTRQISDLPEFARDMLSQSLGWLDQQWDPALGLVRAPAGSIYEYPYDDVAHLVRETAQYALGLLIRAEPGDDARAQQAINSLLDYQFNTPETVYHGTWKRAPQEPNPPPNPTEWRDYDPNWREFIGTTLALALLEYESRLPADLVARIDRALRLAIAGTLQRNVSASYTNIALMCVFLLQYGAERFQEPAWLAHATQLAEECYTLFAAHRTFAEYNSPTYYGVDLYALALWRKYANTEELRQLGAAMEADLWRDIARFYHAGLHNLCGPFDRSYGMDIGAYVSVLNMWFWLAVGRERIVFPDTSQPFDHAWDFATSANYVLPGAAVPEDAIVHLQAFQGERFVERIITDSPRRVATAWQADTLMIGAEDSSSSHRVNTQFHPATAHWQQPDGSIGWLRIRHTAPVDAWAEPQKLRISCTQHPAGELIFHFQIATRLADGAFSADQWELPGLVVAVESNAILTDVIEQDETVLLSYTAHPADTHEPIDFVLNFNQKAIQ